MYDWNDLFPAMPTEMVTEEETRWGMFAHLAGLLSILLGGLAFLGPLVLLLVKGNDSRFVRAHAVAALNFQLTMFIVSVSLICSIVGMVLLWLVLLAEVIVPLCGLLAARRGDHYTTWCAFPFVR